MEAAPVAMVMLDVDGRIVFVNAEAEKLFGYGKLELLGEHVEILLAEHSRGILSSFRREFFANSATRQMGAGRDLYARAKEGRVFPVEIRLNLVEGAQEDWVLASVLDNSEHKRAAQRFRLAVEASPNAMIMVDHEGKIVLLNSQAEKLFGYQGEELLGQKIEILVPEPLLAGHPALRSGFSAEPSRRQMGLGRDVHARRKDGALFPAEIGLNPFETSEGVCVLISVVDISFHRQKLESVGVLAGGIAHDFNNLLGSILADTELALSEVTDGYSPVEEIHNIRTVAIRAAEIVRELMIYAGQERAHRELIDVSWLVQEMVQLLKVSISKNALLKTNLGRNLPAVMGNAPQLRQVAMNLIINASEAIGEQGTINITTSCVRGGKELAPNWKTELPPGEYLKLEVADTGHGMPEGDVARVFDPFFTTKFAGRGLGLAVVQGIVRVHGGAIHLVSDQRHGTTLQVFFPCAIDTATPGSNITAPLPRNRKRRSSSTVLLVEDEDALRLPIAKILRKNGFTAIEAADGWAAIQAFRSGSDSIDLILLDATIPGASSLEVLREVRRIQPQIKVILTSAYALEMLQFPPDAPKFTGFIRKPFQLSDLLRLFEDVSSIPAVIKAAG
jgi:PAS domain S-box-containing protein